MAYILSAVISEPHGRPPARAISVVDGIWLYETRSSALPSNDGPVGVWRRYSTAEFYRLTMQNCGLGRTLYNIQVSH